MSDIVEKLWGFCTPMRRNLSIDRDDFDTIPLLQRPGGWGAANRAFDGKLEALLVEINEAVAA